MTVTNSGGNDVATRIVVVELPPPPVLNFTWAPVPVVAGQPVTFANTTTGAVKSWSWDFGDGTTSTAKSPTKVYAVPGSYPVTLTATGPGGGNAPRTLTKTVVVVAPPPVAAFTTSALSIPIGSSVTFTDTSTGTIAVREWRIDGVLVPYQAVLERVFTTNGVHNVSLTVIGPGRRRRRDHQRDRDDRRRIHDVVRPGVRG